MGANTGLAAACVHHDAALRSRDTLPEQTDVLSGSGPRPKSV
ncbi:MAG: hypothetical protein ACLTY5_07900 [Angelakisella sp.]